MAEIIKLSNVSGDYSPKELLSDMLEDSDGITGLMIIADRDSVGTEVLYSNLNLQQLCTFSKMADMEVMHMLMNAARNERENDA